MPIKINIKKLNPNAILPTKAHESDAGFDLYACIEEDTYIPCHETIKIPTGIAIEIPEGYFGGIYARSGLATKEGLRPANCVGVIDSGYIGEIIVAIHNDHDKSYLGGKDTTKAEWAKHIIHPQERIAQLIIQPIPNVTLQEVKELNKSERGSGGFGSTGK